MRTPRAATTVEDDDVGSLSIAVVGAGRVGRALGPRWAAAGHAIRYGVRDPDDERFADLRDHADVTTPAEAAAGADALLLAVPWGAVETVATQLGELGDTVVLDATNPLAGGSHAIDDGRSGAEVVAATLRGGRVVKAFNTTGSRNLSDPSGYDPAPVMWLAGDDASACELAAGLASDVGFAPVLAGDLAGARELEHLAVLWIRLAHRLGHGPDLVLTAQRRTARP
ncbi:MAG: NADPH-dependent F420 reductase [Actinomycetes bacterium]